MRFGFVGPAYAIQSPLGDNEQLINWRPIKVESPNARTPYLLLSTSGLQLLSNLGNFNSGVRGLYTINGRTFAVAGTHLFEITAGGFTDYGDSGTAHNNIVDDGLTVTMVAGGTVGGSYPTQLLIASGGTITVFSLVSNSYQAITGAPANVLMVEFLDGYFICLTSGNDWEVSNVEDATNWSGLSISQVSVFSDELLSIIASNRLLWIFGAKRAVCYYNSGAPLFPFDVVNGGFLEVGLIAQFSPQRITTKSGTTILWLAGDERGGAYVAAANGFTPARVSDSALEYWLSQQTTISDAIGVARQEEGQNFYDLHFPSANATWTLDIDMGWWHQRSSLIGGIASAHRARAHTFNFGQHIVGDHANGNVYAMSANYLAEFTGPGVAVPIVRTRVGPTISIEGGQLTVPINEFQVDFETGVEPQPPLTDGFGNPRPPYAVFSYSEDFGKTWTPERMIPCGQAGEFKVAAIDRRLGSWRSWTPKVVVSDPIPWRIADAFTNSTQDSLPRLAKSLAKIA